MNLGDLVEALRVAIVDLVIRIEELEEFIQVGDEAGCQAAGETEGKAARQLVFRQ